MQLTRRQALSLTAMGLSFPFLGCGGNPSDTPSKNRQNKGHSREKIKPMSVAESWKRIVAWHDENTFPGKFKLNPGVSAEAIRAFENTIGTSLPEDFRESLRLHDGGDCWILWHGELLTLAAIENQWREYRDRQARGEYAVKGDPSWEPLDIKGPIKPVFWNPRRIYVTDNSGDHLALDLDPPGAGDYGQVIDHSHEVGPLTVLASSWAEFLTRLALDFEDGRYVYFAKEDTVALPGMYD